MKYLNRIIILMGAAMLLPACTDLDTVPEGDTVLESQRDPSMVSSDVNALNAVMIYDGSDDSGWHFDYGYPALSLMFDSSTGDMACPDTAGYNWFTGEAAYETRTYNNRSQVFAWRTLYKYIAAANTVIATFKGTEEDSGANALYLGYGRVARAFGYLNLVQMLAFNYATLGDPTNTPVVPIVTEDTAAETIANNPRASVEEVYKLVIDDLTEAIRVLSLEDVADRPNKSYADLAVAYGVRARAYLAMHKYAEAAADAKSALDESDATFLSNADVSTPGFNSADITSVMWASLVSTTSSVVSTGIINWPSHLCSFDTAGYSSVGAIRQINKPLYDLIPTSDVRKGWWLNEDSYSPLTEDLILDGENIVDYMGLPEYTNVKFHDYNNTLDGSENASDWILMRREEMVLIQAEGLAMSGDLPGGKAALEAWVKANRNPSYVSNAADAEAFQNEVWFQRRIELWGEGHSYFDLMRLNRNMIRVSGGDQANTSFVETQRFNVAAGDNVLLWLIPENEINGNEAINQGMNPLSTAPETGAGNGLSDGII